MSLDLDNSPILISSTSQIRDDILLSILDKIYDLQGDQRFNRLIGAIPNTLLITENDSFEFPEPIQKHLFKLKNVNQTELMQELKKIPAKLDYIVQFNFLNEDPNFPNLGIAKKARQVFNDSTVLSKYCEENNCKFIQYSVGNKGIAPQSFVIQAGLGVQAISNTIYQVDKEDSNTLKFSITKSRSGIKGSSISVFLPNSNKRKLAQSK